MLESAHTFKTPAIQSLIKLISGDASKGTVDIAKLISTNRQECADEAFTKIIDAINRSTINNTFLNVYEQSITCGECKSTVSEVRDDAYQIYLKTRQTLSPENFTKYIKCRVDLCTNEFKADCGHVLTKYYKCERLKVLGEVIIVTFDKYQRKSNHYFPDSMRFPSTDGGFLQYDAVAIVEHFGSIHGGHYICHAVRVHANKCSWYTFDDSRVSEMRPLTNNENVFMIAYHMTLTDLPACTRE